MLTKKTKNRLIRFMPGLEAFFSYKKKWFKADFRSGLSVAAVALPSAIAYAQFMGIDAIAGLYSTILPLIAYAFFGTSRQLIVGPDTATCAVVAAVIAPLAMGNAVYLWQLSIVMTIMIGFWCIIGSRFKLGLLVDLLSRPILMGLLNGVSITIIVDQFAKVCGFSNKTPHFIERLISLPYNIIYSHIPTLTASVITFSVLIIAKKLRPKWPIPLFILLLVTYLSWQFNFQQYGILVIGDISATTLPLSSWNDFQLNWAREMVVPSINIAVICFVSMMLTVRSFALKNNYDVNVDAEFRALGIANIVSALSQGFVVSGTSSRTAVNDSNGGKTQLVSIIAAIIIAIVVFFLISPLKYIPIYALGIILIYSSWSLISFKPIFQLWSRNRQAFSLSLFTLLSVLIIGIIPGIGLAVLLGLIQFLRTIFKPTDQILGIDSQGIIHGLDGGSDVKLIPNVLIYRFNSPLTYFNIGYFKRRILKLIGHNSQNIKWVVIDAVGCYTYPDVNVLIGTEELKKDLEVKNIELIIAGRKAELTRWFHDMRMSFAENIEIVSDLYWAIRIIQSEKVKNESSDAINKDNTGIDQT